MPIEQIGIVFLAFALGGILKGAIGAGAPFLAVPVMAMFVNVPFAVAMFIVPNIISNALQVWQFRAHFHDMAFAIRYAVAGAVGAAMGTVALARLGGAVLTILVAVVVLIYVAFRASKPGWKLSMPTASRIVLPVGVAGGIFQGAIGLSAPVSVTFLNAIGLPRQQFIPTISLFFACMAFAQLPSQVMLGIMTTERFLYSFPAAIPLILFMPVGQALARRFSKQAFDRLILVLLTLIAIRMLWGSLM